MIKAVPAKSGCMVDRAFQWDRNQVLEVWGVSVPGSPTLCFSFDTLENATAKPTTVDAAGVIRAMVPNEMLETGRKINAYVCINDGGVCINDGGVFQPLWRIPIPVEGRARPCYQTDLSEEELVYG